MNDPIFDYLSDLSLPQLQALQVKLTEHIQAKAEAKRLRGHLPPVQTGCVSKAAEALGLDISSLMRDVKRRSS